MDEVKVPHDADFDKGHGFRLHLTVKQIFWGGFLVGALVVIALGFIMMVWKGANLGQYFGGSLDRANQPAAQQGKFWEMADKMFASQADGLSVAQLESYAKSVGVANAAQFKNCLESGKYASLVQSDEQGGESAGVNGTPGTFVISKSGQAQLIPGALPFDTVKQMIDAALKS